MLKLITPLWPILQNFFARFPEAEKISPPLLQLSNVTFGYSEDKLILKGVDIDVGADSRIAIVGMSKCLNASSDLVSGLTLL